MLSFQQKVYEAVKKIPEGRVATYLDIAKAVGSPLAVRAVGGALNKNYSPEIPCHRVVGSDGRIGGYNKGSKAKVALLIEEGVGVDESYLVNLADYRML